ETCPSPRHKPHSHSKNAPEVNTQAHLLRITGVARGAVHGISDSLAQPLLADIGTDMRKWPTDKHCCSWLGLAPKHDISGGKVLKIVPCKIATVRRKPCAWRPKQSSAPTAPLGRSIGGSKGDWVPPKPLSRRRTKSPVP